MAWALLLVSAVAWAPVTNDAVGSGESNEGVSSSSESSIDNRILGGWYARRGQYPYMAALNPFGILNVFCGGSLIHVNYVLTAGHCVHGHDNMLVMLGVTNVKAGEASRYHRWADQIIEHPQYVNSTLANDLALLYLRDPVPTGVHITIIGLPTAREAQIRVGLRCTLTGWGQDSEWNRGGQDDLKVANLVTIDIQNCKNFHPRHSHNHQLCVPGYRQGGAYPCFGDSGSPLVAGGKVHGIMSVISTRCASGGPAAFVHVGSFLPWINNYIIGKAQQAPHTAAPTDTAATTDTKAPLATIATTDAKASPATTAFSGTAASISSAAAPDSGAPAASTALISSAAPT